jgi:hypothetical protein
MESLQGFVQIGKDAAGIIETKSTDALGLYTGNVQACVVFVCECSSGLIMIHDSGQLEFGELCALIERHGACNQISAFYVAEWFRFHEQRLSQIKQLMHVRDPKFRRVSAPTGGFSVAYGTSGIFRVYRQGEASGYVHMIEEKKRISIAELNNFFLEPNARNLKLDVQFCEGSYAPIRSLDKTPIQMLEIMESQPNFFFNNVALLYAAHELGILQLPESIINIVKVHRLQRFRFEEVPFRYRLVQSVIFNKFMDDHRRWKLFTTEASCKCQT